MIDTAPFGTHAPPGFIEKARRMNASGSTWLARYLGRKAVTRYYKANKRAFDVDVSGTKMRLYPHLNIDDKYALQNSRFRDQAWCEKLLSDARAGDVFFDIGANVGAFSLVADKLAPQGLRHFAFEPHPDTRAKLLQNLAFNDVTRVTVVPKGIADFTGTATLFEHVGNEGAASLHGDGKADAPKVDVEIDTLPNLMGSLDVDRIDLLKIDIEGFEDKALIPFFTDTPQSAWPRRLLIEHVQRDQWESDPITHMTAKGYSIIDKGHDDTLLQLPGA